MRQEIIVHVLNEEAFYADIEEMPNPNDQFVVFSNPRKRDGKPLAYVTQGSMAYIFPLARVSFVEVMAPETKEEEIISFFR